MSEQPAKRVCRWKNQGDAFREFATSIATTQSADHIRPLHWYVSCRLVLEGGFLPEEITPRPPFRAEMRGAMSILHYEESVASGGEQAILGGLKTKNVDVVVTKQGIGPVLAVSCKGVTGALRNLTNRLEETIGECTNLHITYPALVLGYLVLLRANKRPSSLRVSDVPSGYEVSEKLLANNDIVVDDLDKPVLSVVRFHNALQEMTGRLGIREDISRYESIGLGLVRPDQVTGGDLVDGFPDESSSLSVHKFFDTLYKRYEERFVLSAPELTRITRRKQWAAIPEMPSEADYSPRLAVS